jgi:hypothetical protein
MRDEPNKSVGWVAAMLALAVAYFGWAFLAGDYFQNDPAAEGQETNFWTNSINQLPNLPSVVGYAFRERLWAVGLIVILEVGVFFLWRVMKKLEKELGHG